jgi:hypothetical protein
MSGPWGPKDDNDDVKPCQTLLQEKCNKKKEGNGASKRANKEGVCECVVLPIFHFSGELMRYVLTSRNFSSQESS